jgi:ABC-2 type transport system permease protein
MAIKPEGSSTQPQALQPATHALSLLGYLRIWAACIRYSLVRTMMFRFDFLLWITVDAAWMAVNLLLIEVIFNHIDSLAGWTKHEMLLLVGTAMLIGRLFTGLFLTNLFEIGKHVRSGTFDFYLAQPGNPLFMVSTRKIDLDGFLNAGLGLAVVIYAARQLGLQPSAVDLIFYAGMVICGIGLHYAALLLIASLTFWIIKTEGIEPSYFTLFEFSRLPRAAFRGLAEVIFVYLFPAVIISNLPARALIDGARFEHLLWVAGGSAAWVGLAAWVFSRGLRRYASASS